MRTPSGPLACALLLLTAGCNIEFTEPPRDRPALLTVSIQVSDEEAETLRLNARLAPGTDENGAPRPIHDDTLRVLGASVAPASIQRNGVRLYSKTVALDPTVELDGVELAAPLVQAGGGGPPPLPFAMRRRAGPSVLVLVPDETIELEMSQVLPPLRNSSTRASWELQIRPAGSGSVLFTIRSPTPPPSVIRVPVGLVAEEPTVELAAHLRVTERWDWNVWGGDYRIELEAVSQLRWTLQWEGASDEEPADTTALPSIGGERSTSIRRGVP